MKKLLAAMIFALNLLGAVAFGYEITESYKLGALAECIAYISTGPLAGKVAVVDGWYVYLHDPTLGTYEKAFSTYGMGIKACPRGIAYLSQGPFGGNFLIADVGQLHSLFLISTAGSLIDIIHADGPAKNPGEGLVQITSGAYQDWIARLANNGRGGTSVYLMRLAQEDVEINAYCEKTLDLPRANQWWTGIAFLPADSPEYPNSFVVSESGPGASRLLVIDVEGRTLAQFTGFDWMEGVAYITQGPFAGKIMLADYWLRRPTIRNLDGSFATASSLPRVGLGLAIYSTAVMSLTWLEDRGQFYLFGDDYAASDCAGYLISRQASDLWHVDSEFRLTRFPYPRSITHMTSDGTYKLFGAVVTGAQRRYAADRLDSGLSLIGWIDLPIQYEGVTFANLVYVPGETPAGDRYVTPAGKSIYSFDASFSDPARVIDISGLVTGNILKFCYDPGTRRFYVLDDYTLRVFSADWQPLGQYVIGGLSEFVFQAIDKITSGDLRNNIVLWSGCEQELIFMNFEYQIAGDLLQSLIDSAMAASLDKGRTNSLTQKLNNARRWVEERKITPAINLVEAFKSEVSAQRGKGIPADAADRWLVMAADVIRGLQPLQ